MSDLPAQQRGGRARAERLSPEERRLIASEAARARWVKEGKEAIPRALYGSIDKPLVIGGLELECYVLEDGRRVLSRAGLLRAIGRRGKAKGGRQYDDEGRLPVFLTADNLKPFITDELVGNSIQIDFVATNGVRAIGYPAELLPQICEVFIDAKEAGVLKANQLPIAEACRILHRGFARVGLLALIDEATGYQEARARNALAEILEEFIAKELRPWVKTFPADYYRELFRLRGWNFPLEADRFRSPILVGKLTNDIVYERLAPGVLDELKRVTPRDEQGRLKHAYHQRLSDNMGHPKLREHLARVVTAMQLSDNWQEFKKNLDKILPKYGKNIELALND